jgi:hypothetical protein
MQNAMRAVRTSKLSTNAAAIHYKSPKMALKAYLAENNHNKSKLGRKTLLSPQQEKGLSKIIIRLAQTEYRITSNILGMCVFTYCETNNIPYPFVKETGMAGRAWVVFFFLRRNLITVPRKAQNS